MAMIDTFRRLAKLGFYFGLGVITAAVDACGDSSTPGPDGQDTPVEARDEATTAEDAPGDEAATAEDAAADEATADEATAEDVVEDEATAADGDADVGADADGDDAGEDLWDVVFE